jgi:hypothetical protein
MPFNDYLKPENTFTIIAHRWGIFTIMSALVYTYHLYWTIYGVDQFCDITRTHVCGAKGKELYQQYLVSRAENTLTAEQASAVTEFFDAPVDAQDASSKVYDTGIALVTIFHMIEWLRQTVFLTSALVNVNLMPLFYALSINIPFGFIAMLVGIGIRFGADGQDCAIEGAQLERGRYLALQILCIFLYIPMMMLHIIFFKVKGVQWLHETTMEAQEEDED